MLDVRCEPFQLFGLFEPQDTTKERFERMPYETAKAISDGVAISSYEPAGAKVRFSTDSDIIAIRVESGWLTRRPHFTDIEAGGFDLYEDTDEGSFLHGAFIPPMGTTEGFESLIRLPDSRPRSFTILFPIHSCIKNLYVGLRPGSVIGTGRSYINDIPVVCYGSSITQGTGTSRPGMAYSNILSRRLNINIHNLGFSGQAKGEPKMAEYIAGLEMSAFIYDYDENAPTAEHLQATHEPFFRIIREKHPDLPIIMLSRPSIPSRNARHNPFREVVMNTYRNAVAAGDKNVWFIDGTRYITENGGDDCILDGIHPNDHGYMIMANQIQKILEGIIANSSDFRKG
jgi:hypothetical protein